MRSMTGYGKATAELGGRRMEAEVRSVNHRYLKVTFRLPSSLTSFESDFEALVRDRVTRGALSVTLRTDDVRPGGWRLDERVVQEYRDGVSRVFAAVGTPISPARALEIVLTLPGVVAPPRDDGADEGLIEHAKGTLAAALEDLARCRDTEGRHLANLLTDHLTALDRGLDKAQRRAAEVPRLHRDRLIDRVQRLISELGVGGELDPNALHREVCILADRADVTEEISRARGHLDRLRTLTMPSGEDRGVGRKIEFLLQELQREINTLGSKSNDAELAHDAIEMKVELERMREQVQNVE